MRVSAAALRIPCSGSSPAGSMDHRKYEPRKIRVSESNALLVMVIHGRAVHHELSPVGGMNMLIDCNRYGQVSFYALNDIEDLAGNATTAASLVPLAL